MSERRDESASPSLIPSVNVNANVNVSESGCANVLRGPGSVVEGGFSH